MSKVIRHEELKDCLSWQLPEMGNGSKTSIQDRSQQLLTAAGIEALQEEARNEGFRQGLEEGRAAGLKEMKAKAAQLENLLLSLKNPMESLDNSVEQQLVQLAMCVARQLVRRELKIEQSQVIAVVKDSLSALPVASREIQLVLHPEDVVLVREGLSLDEEKQNLHIIENPTMTRGGCSILTETSQIDSTVESRLNAIIANVLGGERASDTAS